MVGLGNVLGDTRALGLDAVFPAVLLAIIGSALRRRDGLIAATLGAAVCVILTPVTPGGVPILASAFGALLAMKLSDPVEVEGSKT